MHPQKAEDLVRRLAAALRAMELYALTHPQRVPDTGVPPFDPVEASPMTFERVRHDDFPALTLGVSAGRMGGAAPAVFNASNEEAVSFFLEGRIGFGDIPRAIESALDELAAENGDSRDAIIAVDAAARRHVRDLFRC